MSNILHPSNRHFVFIFTLLMIVLPSIVALQINLVTPTSGSLKGGTAITFYGIFDQNAVIQDYHIKIGNYPCNLTTGGAQPTYLTCTTIDTGSQYNIIDQPFRIQYDGSVFYTDFRYSFLVSLTPEILKVVPSSSVGSNILQFHSIHRITNIGDLSRDLGDALKFQTGKSLCDRIDIGSNQVDQIPIKAAYEQKVGCIQAPVSQAGNFNVSQLVVYGYAKQNRYLKKTILELMPSYQFTTVPAVYSFTPSAGSYKGLQLTINGSGFADDNTKNIVKVDGTNCLISTSTNSEIVCNLQSRLSSAQPELIATNSTSQIDGFISGSGMKYQRYDISNLSSKTIASFKTAVQTSDPIIGTPLQQSIKQTIQSDNTVYGSNFGEVFKGYFLAPFTGNYTFYGQADDSFAVYISQYFGSAQIPSSANIYSDWSNTGYFYLYNVDTVWGDPIFMNAGEYYYMQVYHVQLYGNSFLSIGAQIPNNNLDLYWQTHQVNKISTNFTNVPEIQQFILDNVSGGTYNLSVYVKSLDPNTPPKYQYAPTLNYNASADQFTAAIKSLSAYANYEVSVTAEAYDADGFTTTFDTGKKYVYTVSILLLRSDIHKLTEIRFTNMNLVSYLGTTPAFTNSTIQEHGQVLNGFFTMEIGSVPVTIIDWDGSNTTNIPFDVSAYSLQSALQRFNFSRCSVLRVENYYGKPQYGATWFIDYLQYNDDVSNIILSAMNLAGGDPSSPPTMEFQEIRKYSSNLLLNPIDNRILRTGASDPQISVQVNGIAAACVNNCAFSFDYNVPELTYLSLSGNKLNLTVTDPNTVGFTIDSITVYLDGRMCTISGGTISSFTCDLQVTPGSSNTPIIRAGDHMPEVSVEGIGLVSISPTVNPISIPLDISSVSPTSGNDNGGYNIVVQGTGFPLQISQAIVSICGQNAAISTINNVQLTINAPQCIGSTSNAIQLTYNSLTASSSFTYISGSGYPIITSIDPISSNPALKGVMQIFGSNFGTNISAISVYLSNSTGRVYQLKVLNITDTWIKAGIPGGLPGNFEVVVDHDSLGQAVPNPSTANDFTYELKIYSITPSTGSYYGGTLINITGINFSTDKSQTQIFVGIELNWFCKLQTVTKTYITCRTPPKSPYYTSDSNQIYLYNKLIQIAQCPNGCNFTYDSINNAVNLDSISATSAFQGDIVSINGSNFNIGSNLSIALTHSVTGKVTTIQINSFTASNIPAITIPQIEAGQYFLSVRCDPYGGSKSILFTVKMVLSNLKPSIISSFGGDIIVSGHGLPQSWPATGYSVTLQKGTCYLVPNIIESTATSMKIRIPASHANITYKLNIETPTSQSFTQSFTQSSSGTPTLTLSSSANINSGVLETIVINKGNFPALLPAECYLYQETNLNKNITIDVSGLTNNSLTFSFQHTFSSGIYKLKAFYSEQGWAYPTFKITVASSGPITTTNADMSYKGGFITISGTKISQAAKIVVAQKAGYVISKNDTAAVFQVPSLVTEQTLSQYPFISQSQKIVSFTTFSDSNVATQAFDNQIYSYYTSSNSVCYFGIDMGSGFKVRLNKIRYFPTTKWFIPQTYLSGAIIEASNDNTTWTILKNLDQSVHSGWNSIIPTDNTPYRYIRFSHTNTSSCQIAQFEIYGYELSSVVIPDLTNMPLDLYYDDGVTQQTFSNVLTFSTTKTPIVTSISPKNGNVFGNYNITLSGSNLNGNAIVLIDGVQCVVVSTTSSNIVCTVGSRLVLPSQNTFSVVIDNRKAITQVQFSYVLRWSDPRTWGTDIPPIDGDLVYVPKGMNLLVDQSTPNLTGILVQEGALTFADQIDMQILAGFITVTGGKFEAGTQLNPYQHKLQFILYGDYYGKQQPIFGNKGIGCFQCSFSMYGIQRSPTWSLLASNINPGDTSFTVQDNVDWVAGEKIVIAASGFDHNEAQQRIITSISGKTIEIDSNLPFKYKHLGIIQQYGTHSLDMRAQVGLLTRNIIVRGDDSSVQKDYGAHLLLAGRSQNGLKGHIAYTQFTKCGQPSILGRYCIHFHMNGVVTESFVRGNAVHHSMARVITLHGVHFLKVEKNVGYQVKGHNYFIQDGIQTNNVLQYNIAIKSQESFKMGQTDMSVASFWVTNPLNHLRYNRAGGGDFYGFWYEIKPNPDGPSKNTQICPQGMRLGESHDNVAHSYKRFGLRIFKLTSRVYPCQVVWPTNPTFQSLFYNYILYKNGEAGLLAEQTGHSTYLNFTVADNKLAGMQFYLTNLSEENVTAKDSAIIGISKSNPPSNTSIMGNSSGIITPRSDRFKMTGLDFYNFQSTMIPFKICSKCDQKLLFINGARQQFAQMITYTNITALLYVKFIGHKKEIIYDLDGSLTRNFDGVVRPSATLMNNWKHFENQSNCFQASSTQWQDTLICDQTVTIRRVMITQPQPQALFKNTPMKIQNILDSSTIVPQNSTDYSEIISYMQGMEPMGDTRFSYAIPYAAGRTYNLWWLTGLDFNQITIDSSRYFTQNDNGIILKFNYTENRQLFEISKTSISDSLLNLSLSSLDPANCNHGEYYHDINESYIEICVSGRERTEYDYIHAIGIKCRYLCTLAGDFIKQDFVRVWSNTTQWPNGVIPQSGENVTIPGQWTIIVDIQPNPMDICQILGDVIIQKSMDFVANGIWIRAGSLRAGQPGNPYTKNLNIILTGQKNDKGFTVDPLVSGNKMLVVNGKLNLYGVEPQTKWTTLSATVYPNDTSMVVDSSRGWNIGDQLVIAPSFNDANQYQRVTIVSVNEDTIYFTPQLNYTHEGDMSAYKQNGYGSLDMRAKVGHITRNIKIMAGNDEGWGYRVLVYSFWDGELGNILRTGSVNLYGVQFLNGGQYDTDKASLQFYQIPSGANSSNIQSCSFVDCKSYCINIDQVSNIAIKNNVFYKATLFHVRAINIQENYQFISNLMIGVHKRPTLVGFNFKQQISCYSSYQYQRSDDGIFVRDNFCQGSQGHGFAIPHMSCNQSTLNPFQNNTAGSCFIGFLFNKDIQTNCLSSNGVLAYASRIGFMAHPPNTTQVKYSNFMIADCQRAVTLRFGKTGYDQSAYFSDSWISAISRPSCQYCYGNNATKCADNHAIRLLVVTINGQKLPKTFGFDFDVICRSQSFDAKAFLSGVTFENYNLDYSQSSLSACANNVIFKRHLSVSDLTGSHNVWNSTCTNCSIDAYGRFDPPNASEIGWFGGCGSILCTGNNNYLVEDHDGKFLPQGGTIIANNSVIGDYLNCTKYNYMNGHHCLRNDLGILQYQSIAPDFNTRIMWPVYLTYGGWTSQTNGWKEWEWSGNQPLNKRLGRFTSIIQYQQIYNMSFVSMPPEDMILQFQRRTLVGNDSDWIIVKLYYPKPNSIRVMDKNGIIRPIPLLDNSEQASLQTQVNVCGANKFFHENYTIHFVITGNINCQVRVSLTNSIQLTMHFQMSIDQFYNNAGETKLVDRMCALLGITDQSRVKIVGIYTGSVRTQLVIEEQTTSLQDSTTYNPSDGKKQIQALSAQLDQLISSNSINQDLSKNGFGPLFSISHQAYYLEDQQKQQESSLPIGIIVGVTVGVLLLIVAIITVVIIVYFVRKSTLKVAQDQVLAQTSEQNPKNYNVAVTEQSILDIAEKKVQPTYE